jgi:hypothetical protein
MHVTAGISYNFVYIIKCSYVYVWMHVHTGRFFTFFLMQRRWHMHRLINAHAQFTTFSEIKQ